MFSWVPFSLIHSLEERNLELFVPGCSEMEGEFPGKEVEVPFRRRQTVSMWSSPLATARVSDATEENACGANGASWFFPGFSN